MMRRVWLSTAIAGLLFSNLAWASEGGGEVNLFAGDIGNAIWTLVIFVLVIVVLGKFAWGPLLNALQQREQFIRTSLQEAKDDREAAEARLQEYEERLQQATTEATQIVEQGRQDADKAKARIEETARTEADKMLNRAKREIDLAKQSAIKDLYATSAELATDIAEKVLKRELSSQDHERLIEESIEELNRQDRN
jgi:F-type H+-transporting ATPase subunit b